MFLIDPLDGSSNIDVNVSVGTIFRYTDEKLRLVQRYQLMTFFKRKKSSSSGYIIYELLPCWFIQPEVVLTDLH